MRNIFLIFVVFLSPPVLAEKTPAPPVVLLELFTSQGCYSCPPAEALVRDYYAGRDDVAPLEFHVDYWNDLIYGSAGAWADPFSKKEYTARQDAYRRTLRASSMYTPQMIVQGRHHGSGANQGRIDSFIQTELERGQPLSFYFSGTPRDGLSATVEGALRGDEVFYYAVYLLEETTEIPSGENKGKTLTSSHIVTETGRRAARERRLSLPAIDGETQGCAVWVQRPQTGFVVGAARCPGG